MACDCANLRTFRTAVLPALDVIDSIAGPGYLDIRTTTCSIITRTTTLGVVGSGGPSGYVDGPILNLPNYIEIRHVSTREVAGSGGRYEVGDVRVGPVRPSFCGLVDCSAGGFTEAQLDPGGVGTGDLQSGPTRRAITVIYRLKPIDPNGGTTGIDGDYRLVDIRRDRSMRFMLTITRRRSTP